MALSSNNRDENIMYAIVKAMGLTRHTMTICNNKKVFNPEHDFNGTMTQRIVDTAIGIYMDCFEANGISARKGTPMFEENMKERIRLQKSAIQKCNDLYALSYLSKKQFHVSLRKIKYWGKLIQEVKRLIVGWNESDIRRLRP